jgi:hypothetical protein
MAPKSVSKCTRKMLTLNNIKLKWAPRKIHTSTVEPGYNDIGLCDTTYIASAPVHLTTSLPVFNAFIIQCTCLLLDRYHFSYFKQNISYIVKGVRYLDIHSIRSSTYLHHLLYSHMYNLMMATMKGRNM